MTRTTKTLLTIFALAGCTALDTPPDKRGGTERMMVLPAAGGSFFADYSRDGRLVFERVIAGKSGVFVANGEGDASNAKRVSFGVWDWGPRWSPDGKWIAFQRDGGLQNDILIVPADSGAEVVVAGTTANEQLAGWLSDGSGLLFVRSGARGGEPWTYRIADRSSAKAFDVDGSVAVTAPGGGVVASVGVAASPDGKWFAYTLQKAGNSTVWVWDRSTKTHRQLTTEGFETAGVECFSPDSRRILYESRRTGSADLWTVDIVTGEKRQLTQDVAEDVGGLWSPDGRRVAFASNRGGQQDLWVLSTGEADIQRITDDVAADFVMRWTPDGKGILALVSPGHAHLYSVSMTDSVPVALTSGDWDVSGAVLSRDGSRIAYVGNKNGDNDIWTVAATGGEPRLVSGGPGNDAGPHFSPDGKSIAFTSARSGNPDIWVAATDSGAAAPKQLTNWPSTENNAEWSPDGKTIAFLSTRESPGTDLWTVPAGGGIPRRLTRLGTVASTFDWSTDSRTIVFAAQVQGASGDRVVFTIPSSGGAPKQLAPPTSGTPEWSPDGRKIAVTQCIRGYCNIEVRDLSGAVVNTLSPAGDNYEFQTRWSHDATQVLIATQDLATNAKNRVFLRPATGGPGRELGGRFGQALPVGFTAGDRAAVVLGQPYGMETQQIAVYPPAAKAP